MNNIYRTGCTYR